MPVRPMIASSMNIIEKMNREKLGAIEAESEALEEVTTDKDEEESDGEEVRNPMKWWAEEVEVVEDGLGQDGLRPAPKEKRKRRTAKKVDE